VTTLRLSSLVLLFVLALGACAPAATPAPTTDANALSTRIAANIFATQTASVPTATSTPVRSDTPFPTATPRATMTPAPPTLTPTKTPIPDPSKMNDDAYRTYLAQKFSKVGDHVLTLKSVDVDHYRISGVDNTGVTFNIDFEEANYFIQENTSAARRVWVTGLLRELKGHWPRQKVSGSLLWSYDSFDITAETDCSSMGNTLLDDGWVHLVYLAWALYSPDYGDDIACPK
jgi:hypothetical protein